MGKTPTQYSELIGTDESAPFENGGIAESSAN
jgi:hypothetical protein